MALAIEKHAYGDFHAHLLLDLPPGAVVELFPLVAIPWLEKRAGRSQFDRIYDRAGAIDYFTKEVTHELGPEIIGSPIRV